MSQFRRSLGAFAVAGLIALLGATPALGEPAAGAAASPIGAHSMLQLDTPFSFKERMFAEAAAMHASAIRLDVQPSLVFTDPTQPPDFSGLDEVVALSQQYHLRVVADLLSIPWWISSCGPSVAWTDMPRCGTDDLTDYQSMLAQIVAHADPVIRDWEIWNEPDDSGFFSGTPQQYARMLRAAHDTIKQIDPQANILLGGISRTAGMSWLAQVFATPGADAAHAFDIANVHERGRLAALAPDIESWKKFLTGYGFDGPLWVTEHGYPADPAYQYDPAYAGGAMSQAAFLTASIPTLVDAGASEVFVTERDNLGGQFASEGILGGSVLDPPVADPVVVEKPSYSALSALAQCYLTLGHDCAGPPPGASPGALAIAPTLVGASTVTTVTVTNPGGEPLRLGQVTLAGAAGSGLGLAGENCSGQLLEPAQACTVSMRYAPTAGGPSTSTLQVPSDNGTLAVAVSAQALSVSQLTWLKTAFQATGAFDRAGEVQRLTVQVTNPLPGPVPVAGVALEPRHAPGFALEANGCQDATLPSGASCRVSVMFRPARRGIAQATLALQGSGGALRIGLLAGAFAPPTVTKLAATDRTYCFSASSRNLLLVVTDQPALIRWQVLRRPYPLAPRCRRAGGAPRRRARTARAGRGWRAWAGGRTASVAAARLIRGTGRSVAALVLPVGSRGGLAPGSYRLSVSARNAHGASEPQTAWITVVP